MKHNSSIRSMVLSLVVLATLILVPLAYACGGGGGGRPKPPTGGTPAPVVIPPSGGTTASSSTEGCSDCGAKMKMEKAAAKACDNSDRISLDDGMNISWFGNDLTSQVNITKSLGGFNTNGSFDPKSSCPRMAFNHEDERAKHLWVYDGSFREVYYGGATIRSDGPVEWSADGRIYFTFQGVLASVTPDGSNMVVTNIDDVTAIDSSPDGSMLLVIRPNHGMEFISKSGIQAAFGSPDLLSFPKWQSDQTKVCGVMGVGPRCLNVQTGKVENTPWTGGWWGISFAPDGSDVLLVNAISIMLFNSGKQVSGTFNNPDWFTVKKSARQPIKFGDARLTPAGTLTTLCPTFVSSFSGSSVVDFLKSVNQPIDLTSRQTLMANCGANSNSSLLSMLRGQ